jgi:addiction module HigA family antidote
MKHRKITPIHPGEVLLEEFLKPMGVSQNRLALSIGVHPCRINEIVLRKRAVTADTALRLARYFGTSAKFWLGLQADYDLDVAEDQLGDRLAREIRAVAAVGEGEP